VRFLSGLVSGELVRAHLHHSPEAERAAAEQGIAHFFIYRDPRDVAVSEAHYLRSMNRWHKLHPHFKRLPSFDQALSLCIEGLECRGPNCRTRTSASATALPALVLSGGPLRAIQELVSAASRR
jgi:hypothetical protein